MLYLRATAGFIKKIFVLSEIVLSIELLVGIRLVSINITNQLCLLPIGVLLAVPYTALFRFYTIVEI